MKVLVYSAKDFEIKNLEKLNGNKHKLKFVPDVLNSTTAVMAAGYDAISIFFQRRRFLGCLGDTLGLGCKVHHAAVNGLQ